MPGRLFSSRRSLGILCLVLFLTFLDNTIVSVALSNIQSTLAAGVQDLQWIVDGYMLAFAVFMLSGGTLGDILGRKKVMLTGVSLFIVGSAVAMLANSVDLLVGGRVLMGLGAAASEPGTLSMIRHLFPEKKSRSKALGVWAAVSGIALAFGPIIGGIIIGFSNWRGVFAFSVIFGLIALIAGIKYLPENADPKGRKLDIKGLISGGVSICAVTFAFILGENRGYSNPAMIALFVVSALSMAAFILIETKSADPVLPLGFFRKYQFSVANAVAFTANFGIFAVFFLVALYLQLIANYSGYRIALAFIAMMVAIVVSAIIAGRWNASHHTIPLTAFGCLLSAAGILLLNASINPNVSALQLSWVLAVAGVGFGICLVTMTSTVLSIVPPERSGMAASTVNTFRELGGVFGVAILGSIVNAQLNTHLIARLRQLHLPTNFQSFVVYAITHGGHTPANAHISIAELASHAALIAPIQQAAFDAFGKGVSIALNLAASLLVATAVTAIGFYSYHRYHRYHLA